MYTVINILKYISIYIELYKELCECEYIYIYIHVYVYIYTYIYIYTVKI